MKKIAVLSVALLLASFCAVADTPAAPAPETVKPTKKNPVIVFVNLQKVLDTSEFFQRMRANLVAAAETSKSALKVKNDEITEKRKAFLADSATMTPQERESRTREIDVLEKEFSFLQEVHKGMYADKQRQADRLFKEGLEKVIGDLSKENGWDVVFNRAFETVLWNSDAVDQTDWVIRRLKEYPIPDTPLTAKTPSPAPAKDAPPKTESESNQPAAPAPAPTAEK